MLLPYLSALLTVQNKDQQIFDEVSRQQRAPQQIKQKQQEIKVNQEHIAHWQQNVITQQEIITTIHKKRKQKQQELATLNEQQQATKKNDIYIKLKAEISQYQETIDMLETEELEALETLDDIEKTTKQHLHRLEQSIQKYEEDISFIENNITISKQRISQLEQDKIPYIKNIPLDIYQKYQRIIDSTKDVAITTIQGEQCTGCNLKIPQQTVIELANSSSLLPCDNCGRLLYESSA